MLPPRVHEIPISIETCSLPALARSYPCHFTFYVANPISSIASRPQCKHLPEMNPKFGAGLVIPDLWQQEAVRACNLPHLTILVSRGTTTYGA